MKRTGMKTATSEIVIERIVKPISFPPLSAAVSGSSPPSIRRTMFSSMTIASSTTKPTESVSAMSERLSSEKFRSDIAANVPTIEAGTARLGMSVARTLRRNRKITRTTSAIVRTSVNSTSWTDSRIGTERSKRTSSLQRAGELRPQRRELRLDRVHDGDRVRARLALDRERDDLPVVIPVPDPVVLDAVHDLPEVAEGHGRAVAVRDDHRPVRGRVEELAVRLHGERLVHAVERPDGQVRVLPLDRGRHLVDADPPGRELRRVEPGAHGELLRPRHLDLRDARDRREALRDERLGDLVDRRERHRRRREDEVEDGLVGRVDLLERRRRRHARRKLAGGRGDRRLDVLGGRVDVAVERELERDLRRPLRARRVDRVEARDRRELPLEGRRDRGGHRLGARAREARRHLDRREVDVREVADGQRAESDRAEQEDPRHDERRHDGPPDERLGDAHPLDLVSVLSSTFAPGNRRSCPSVTTRSPAASPFAITTTPSPVGPGFTARGSTVRSAFTT